MKISPGLKRYARIRLREYPCRHQCKSVFNENGEVLIIILGVMILLMIFIPALVYYVQQEAKWTIKAKRTTTAFHLAEAGIDRGYWKLKERSEYWDKLARGEPIEGYNNFEVAYEDIPSTGTPLGKYTVRLSSHSTNPRWRVIQAIGQDKSTREVRSLELVVSRQGTESSIFGNSTIEIGGNAEVHWGPIKSRSNIKNADDMPRYPRKFARGTVEGLDPDGVGGIETDDKEWWSRYPVPDLPEYPFSFWKASATANGTLNVDDLPAGGYQLQGRNDSRNLVWYWDGDLEIKGNTYIYGTLVVMGNLNLAGTNRGEYTTTIPSQASLEYQDSTALAYWNSKGWTNGGSYTFSGSNKVKIRGFIYVDGSLTLATGDTTINGALVVKGTTMGGGNLTIYYDENIEGNIRTLNETIIRKSWKELKLDWPAGL